MSVPHNVLIDTQQLWWQYFPIVRQYTLSLNNTVLTVCGVYLCVCLMLCMCVWVHLLECFCVC